MDFIFGAPKDDSSILVSLEKDIKRIVAYKNSTVYF